MKNIFSDAGNFARHTIEAGKVVDINEHEPVRSLQDINAVEIKAKHLPNPACQFEHLGSYRYFFFRYCVMQWRCFHNGMYLLACDIEFDVKASVLNITHCEIITIGVELLMRHLFWCSHKVYVLHGATVTGFDDDGIDVMRHFGQSTRMTYKVGCWHR